MAKRIIFSDQVCQYPDRYDLSDLGNGTWQITLNPGTVSTPGTPLSASNLNAIADEVIFKLKDTAIVPNTYTTDISALTTYYEGLTIMFKASNTNTGASTININGIGAVSIKKTDNSGDIVALQANDLIKNKYSTMTYDGTEFLMNNPSADLAETIADISVVESRLDTDEQNISSAKTETVKFAVLTGSNNAYGASISTVDSLYSGLVINIVPNVANTGACTLQVNSLDAKNIKYDGSDLTIGVLEQNKLYTLVYDGIVFNLQPSASIVKDISDELDSHKADNAKHILICTSTTRPSNPQEGQHIYETDTKKTMKWTGNVWQAVGHEDFTPPATITSFIAKPSDSQVILSWINPTDSDFLKTKIVRKTGSYPSSNTDGTVVYEGTGTSYTDTGLVNGTQYYYRAFTFDSVLNVNEIENNQEVTATPKAYVIYGVKIDTANSNPSTALTYTDDAVGFTPATGNNGTFNYGSWADKFPFNAIKPCLYKAGTVNYYLNPNNYAQKVDGVTASDITSGNDGDVMVEFPKVYWKFETIGTDLYIRYSDTKIDDTYKCLAHMRGTTEKDKCYISAYLGYLWPELRSLSGKTPTVSQTIEKCRLQAQNNGTGYDQMAYFQLLMLQVLFVVMFKSRDSQTALGRGYVDGNSVGIATGGTDAKGLFYGETTGKFQNKFCGIEDFYGNYFYWIDGFYSNANRHILIANQSFNDTGSGYTDYGQGATANLDGYISGIQGTTETGFVVKATAGSATTYYADYGNLCADGLPCFGGGWSNADDAGAFYLYVYYSASTTSADVAGRLLAL
jgi:hypothetical protein